MEIKMYSPKYRNQVIALILYLQNFDNNVDLSLEEQPDMQDITKYYLQNQGGFWIATNDNDDVIGTIGLLQENEEYGVLKKFFVHQDYRGSKNGISAKLFDALISSAKENHLHHILLDTPEACHRAHHFYKKNGFEEIDRNDVPIKYDYPDRDSLFFIKNI
ncbi:GNAT family N-acetyltransferase [Companilactobacillus keshanensis]|uniref:GNAT family N-acetyltransferase n=1 Tax=Companilactobacillus keshanensis TaxID=2486003 RepID=A0ABW4BUU1_9LACO|nr:GNAT family N-acetyltransferase [Companilactobacillus keshanensis]